MQLKNSQQPNDPVFFLDRQLGAYKLPAILRAAGFIVVTHLERYGSQRDTEPDPSIAIECGKQKNILITADPDFEHTYGAEILLARIAVLYLVNNHDGADKWGARGRYPPRIRKATKALRRPHYHRGRCEPSEALLSKED